MRRVIFFAVCFSLFGTVFAAEKTTLPSDALLLNTLDGDENTGTEEGKYLSPLSVLLQIPEDLLNQAYSKKLDSDKDGFGGKNKEQGFLKEVGPQRRPMVGLLRNMTNMTNMTKLLATQETGFVDNLVEESKIAEEKEAAARNWLALEKVFEHQDPTSGEIIEPRTWKSLISASSPRDRAISMGFFFSEACYSLLAMEELAMKEHFFEDYQPRLAEIKDKISLSLEYLLKDEVIAYLESDNRHTNRGFFHAKAYLMCGKLLNNSQAIGIGETFLQKGLAAQLDTGVFPENGGSDSSYQAVSLLKLAEIYTVFQKPEIFAALNAGTLWELTQITVDGEVLATTNTRTGLKPTLLKQNPKGINYMEIVRGLVLSGIILKEPGVVDVARAVADYDKLAKKKKKAEKSS